LKKYSVLELIVPYKATGGVNQFTDLSLLMNVTMPNGTKKPVEEFCNAQDGSVYKAQFMPTMAGTYSYNATLKGKGKSRTVSGRFQAVEGANNAPVRVDSANP
jgi:hypothetical protein